MFLGFELELFNPKELVLAYWYLEYFCDLRLQNKNLAWRPKVKKRTKPTKKPKPSLGTPPPPTAEFLVVEAYMMLCRGLCQSIIGFKRAGVEVLEINSRHLEHWFANRFEDFNRVPQPSPMSLKSWKTQLGYFAKETPQKLLQTGSDSFTQAKNLLTKACSHSYPPLEQEIKVLRQLIKVCITNTVLLLGIGKVLDLKQPGVGPFQQIDHYRLRYSLDTHPLFPILILQKVETQEKKISVPTDDNKSGLQTQQSENEGGKFVEVGTSKANSVENGFEKGKTLKSKEDSNSNVKEKPVANGVIETNGKPLNESNKDVENSKKKVQKNKKEVGTAK